MKPVLVLQHLRSDGPSWLAHWLACEGIAMDLRCTEDAQDFPADLGGHAALAILGGAMSANDPLPSLRQAEALVRQAVATGVPVIGHCLGGQLIARALGAAIGPSPQPEVGWHRVSWRPEAAEWFGAEVLGPAAPEVFQWHFEAFELPIGAVPLAGNAACPHQAFAIGEGVLAMQFHVELDAAKLACWLEDLDPDYKAAQPRHPRQVQLPDTMRVDASARLAAQQRLAAIAYARWWSRARA
jgi:GMP synthase (glutamine-hydrolysing)